jgi:hypothetical protein
MENFEENEKGENFIEEKNIYPDYSDIKREDQKAKKKIN